MIGLHVFDTGLNTRVCCLYHTLSESDSCEVFKSLLYIQQQGSDYISILNKDKKGAVSTSLRHIRIAPVDLLGKLRVE